ncbi:MAG: nucleoside triphosphate pyrophosphohydrolase, partial [Promethearchaeota archaeon]
HEPSIRMASDEELDLLIREKIVEESKELLVAGTLEEIADIVEAVLGLLNLRAISWTELENMRLKKKEERGGFEKGFVLHMRDPES